MCRWDRPSRPKELTKEPVTVLSNRTPAGPSLNYDDVPEAGFRSGFNRRIRFGSSLAQNSQKHIPCRFQTVAEENEEHRDDELSPEADQWVEAQWPCASCTFLNNALINVCEMCGQQRVPAFKDILVNPGIQVVTSINQDEQAPAPANETNFVGRKWPSLQQSLQQATEKSWEFCEQSSMASSMVDVARLADVDADCKDVAPILETDCPVEVSSVELYDIMSDTGSHAVGPAEGCSPELYDIMSNTGSHNADKDRVDTSSMASWWHVDSSSEASKADGPGNCASAASSWVDVGNLADFEGHSEQDEDPKTIVARGATSWSSLVSEVGDPGRIKAPRRSGVPVPPLTRSQASRKKAPALEVVDEDFDDQDGRGRCRASRQYRRRR